MSISITGQPHNGTASIDSNNTIKYASKPWFRGYDTFKYEIMYKDESGQLQTEEKEAHMRVRIGVMLNKPLLITPTGYLFAETKSGTTGSIKVVMGTSAFQSLVPAKDTWLNRRYNRCAIVGNGGSLRGSKRGQEIDSHDFVVRLNLSPLRGFEEDIGTKMNITIGNGPNAASCWKRNQTDLPNNVTYEILAQLSFAPQYKNYSACVPKYPWITYTPMSYLFIDQVDNILNEYHRVMFNGTDKKYRSTGMMAVTAMAMICDHVSVYGFERGPNMENNYYDTKYEREWSGHNYFAEKAYYTDLANGTGLFERFLELYDLYESFSYIVD